MEYLLCVGSWQFELHQLCSSLYIKWSLDAKYAMLAAAAVAMLLTFSFHFVF